MPKPSRYVLIWLDEREYYELHLHGQLQQRFQRGDDDAFSRWLEEHTAFAFGGNPVGFRSSKKPGLAGPAIGTPIGHRIDIPANVIWDHQPR